MWGAGVIWTGLNPHNRLSAFLMQISYAYCLVLNAPSMSRIQGLDVAEGSAAPELPLAMLARRVQFKHTARDLSNAEFVRLLYRLLLNRERVMRRRSASSRLDSRLTDLRSPGRRHCRPAELGAAPPVPRRTMGLRRSRCAGWR